MPKVKFTQADLDDSKLEPGWRVLDVIQIGEWGPGKADPSSLTIAAKFKIAEGSKGAGTPINYWFSEKKMNIFARYMKCFMEKAEVNKEYEASQTVGRKVQGYCEYNISTGFNEIKDFRPVGR